MAMGFRELEMLDFLLVADAGLPPDLLLLLTCWEGPWCVGFEIILAPSSNAMFDEAWPLKVYSSCS